MRKIDNEFTKIFSNLLECDPGSSPDSELWSASTPGEGPDPEPWTLAVDPPTGPTPEPW